MYEGDDRVRQVNWLKGIADEISFGSVGEGSPEQRVEYFLEHTEIPEWFDSHDRRLLIEMISNSFEIVITLGQAAEFFPLAYSTLAQAAREGRIKARRSGKVWLTTQAAIEEAIEEGKLKPRRRGDIE